MHFSLNSVRRAARVLAGAALIVLACGSPAGAQEAVPGDSLRVYVLTMGPGEAVWERFGHNAIWIHDPQAGTDIAYNYGMFSFDQEGFLLRFLKGEMLYWMEGFDTQRTLSAYVYANRSVWAQELNLTPAQRIGMRDFLRWNERPENRFYRYDYYRDNCSTRIRDAIDRIIGGQLHAQTQAKVTGESFRSHTLRLMSAMPLIYTGIDLAGGQPIDEPISAWEEMFLPMSLRDHLRTTQVRDASGALVPLVLGEQTLFDDQRAPIPAQPPNWIVAYLAIGVVVGGALYLLGRNAARRSARAVFVIGASTVSLLIGILGAVILGLWLLTDHVGTHRNENVLLANPLALLLAGALPFIRSAGAARFALRLAYAIAILALAGAILQVLPGFDQVNGDMVALLLPIQLGIAAGLRSLTTRPRF